MCLYWKKDYLCGCTSHIFRDRCYPCLHSASDDQCENHEVEETPRKSHFQCFDCLVKEDKAEKAKAMEDAEKAQEQLIIASKKAEEQRKKDAEKARQQQIRETARIQAEKDKEEEIRRKRDLKAEQERVRREGGAWVDAASGKRAKGRKGNTRGGRPPSPISSSPLKNSFAAGPGIFGTLATENETPSTTDNNATSKENVAQGSKNDKNGTGLSNNLPAPKGNSDGGSGSNIKESSDTRNTNTVIFRGKNPVKTILTSKDDKDSNAPSKDTTKANGSTVDPGGRAGRWGPSTAPKSPPKTAPKKILKPEKPAGWKKA